MAHVEERQRCQERLDDLTKGGEPHPSWIPLPVLRPPVPQVGKRPRPTTTLWISPDSASFQPPATSIRPSRNRLMVVAPRPTTRTKSLSISRRSKPPCSIRSRIAGSPPTSFRQCRATRSATARTMSSRPKCRQWTRFQRRPNGLPDCSLCRATPEPGSLPVRSSRHSRL